jgi:hypothetical protein
MGQTTRPQATSTPSTVLLSATTAAAFHTLRQQHHLHKEPLSWCSRITAQVQHVVDVTNGHGIGNHGHGIGTMTRPMVSGEGGVAWLMVSADYLGTLVLQTLLKSSESKS